MNVQRSLLTIRRGRIYLMGLPFCDGRPLTFVDHHPDGSVTLETRENGFEPARRPDGGEYSPELEVVIKHKVKYGVVLQEDTLNRDRKWRYTIVAPIDSIKPADRVKGLVQRAMQDNNEILIHYTTCTGMRLSKSRRSDVRTRTSSWHRRRTTFQTLMSKQSCGSWQPFSTSDAFQPAMTAN